MRQNNFAWLRPDARITVRGRFDDEHFSNTIVLFVETEAASLPPRANVGIGAR
jgi:hypothetical protein